MLDSLHFASFTFLQGLISMSSDEHDDDGKKKEKPAGYKTWTGWRIPRDEAEADDMNFDIYDVDGVKWDGYLQIGPKPLHSIIYTRGYLKGTHWGFMIECAIGYDVAHHNYVYRYVTHKGRCLLAIARTVEEAEAVLGDPVMFAAVCARRVERRSPFDNSPWFKDETMGDDSNG